MRIRKCLALGGFILIFLGCLIVYKMTDYTLYLEEESAQKLKSESHKNEALKEEKLNQHSNREPSLRYSLKCSDFTNIENANIQMSDLYNRLEFDNIDGGSWKQGWEINVDSTKWNDKNRLKVFVVPHSHNDPGWLKTFQDYYISKTRSILNNMLKQLSSDPTKKFIWAEISFFSLWWNELSQEDQDKVKKLVHNGQLELVTGGWVMNDEANTHYYSMITQLTEGHQWIKSNIQSVPKNGWTIDPFGESPVMAYLLKKSGIENLVIHRVHYSIKKYLAQTKNLEFWWRQFWDANGSNDVLTHMTPFYSYDVPHTCGPDPKICCQFDFKRLPGNGMSCPWGIFPKPITKNNVAMRAEILLDQYRKKAELYRTNVLLVPLGDDFRYQTQSEWIAQFDNYNKIFSYVNNNPELGAELRFGTLADFFTALSAEPELSDFPSLSGDFFTYADRDDHYWSGYYTSRPFYKRMDRILIGYHRAAEVLFSLGWSARNRKDAVWLLKPQTGFANMLREARRSLSLFQHHDGVTGTARDNVMEDYAQKMVNAITYSKHIIQQVAHLLLRPSKFSSHMFDPEQIHFDFDDQKKNFLDISQRKVIQLSDDRSKTVVLFNSLAHKRTQLVSFLVTIPFVQVYDPEGSLIETQISPIFSQDEVMEETRFEVFFVARVPALGLASYRIEGRAAVESGNTLSRIKIFNAMGKLRAAKGFEGLVETGPGREFSVDNRFVTLTISEKGLLKSVTHKETNHFIPLNLDFVSYRARKGKERSGAYLFLPDGEASIVSEENPLVRVHEGPLFARVELRLTNVKHILHINRVDELSDSGIEVVNIVDILREDNYELAMRMSSHIKSGSHFYTDLNGFQIIKRTRYAKLPIQGNFYPMPSAAYIEDDTFRLTLLTGQPLGVSSLREGELEVLQDRRLGQDDNRGLGQGVLDNKITPNVFRILVEKRLENCYTISSFGSLSINAYRSSLSLLNPIVKMILTTDIQYQESGLLLRSYSPVDVEPSDDVHLIVARTLDEEDVKPRAGYLFHRSRLDQCFPVRGPAPVCDGTVNIASFLPYHFGGDVTKSSLSFLHDDVIVNRKDDQSICPMDFLSLVLS